jgi:hypothetical protein
MSRRTATRRCLRDLDKPHQTSISPLRESYCGCAEETHNLRRRGSPAGRRHRRHPYCDQAASRATRRRSSRSLGVRPADRLVLHRKRDRGRRPRTWPPLRRTHDRRRLRLVCRGTFRIGRTRAVHHRDVARFALDRHLRARPPGVSRRPAEISCRPSSGWRVLLPGSRASARLAHVHRHHDA